MYGAGSIGRGFIGKVFSDSGYEVCFLDIVPEVIRALNARGAYDVKIVSDEAERLERVKNVRALNAETPEAVEAIAACDIMATSVGVNVMERIAKNIAAGVQKRMAGDGRPLDIILAENQLDADKLMRSYIYAHLDDAQRAWADAKLGLVEASIGRMVPKLTPEDAAGDPLLIAVEAYAALPVDRDGFKGEIPELVGLVPFTPFGFYIKRKLFIHNMAHAVCAYSGWQRHCAYLHEAVRIPEIRDRAKRAMRMIAQSLHTEYGVPMDELDGHIDDLLFRFSNKALKETVARVAGDPIRKLRRDDRMVGAALYALEHGFDPAPIVEGIVMALRFENEGDPYAVTLQGDLREKGLAFVMERYMGLEPDEPLARMVAKAYGETGK
jgi:mannitol-1-phosphate 5-dehydrogenase